MEALINEHPLRTMLSDELHARPYAEMAVPERLSHIALLTGESGADNDRAQLVALCDHFKAPHPPANANHFIADLGDQQGAGLRVRWERHTEFCTYTFFNCGAFAHPFEKPVTSLLPKGWLENLEGELFTAVHLALEPKSANNRKPDQLPELFGGNSLVGCWVAGQRALVYSDHKIHEDRFSRILIRDQGLSPRQAGRLAQRLLEIETYRDLALAALPLARGASPRIGKAEQKLADVAARMTDPSEEEADDKLLTMLSNLAANIEDEVAATAYRYQAARAYYGIVQRRLGELRQERIEGLQTFGEFLDRRLAPAMATCLATEQRQEALSKRAARMTSLLRARVDVELEEQNKELLQSMDRRAQLQLRLQETVEGLSVAAISYYMVGLVRYGFKGLKEAGVPINIDLATGLSVPLVILTIWFGLKRMKRLLHNQSESRGQSEGPTK